MENFLNLHYYPEKILRTVCAEVTEFTDEITNLSMLMLEKMYESDGIGLAAPQVGIPLQIICIDISPDKSQPLILFNPKVLDKEGEIESSEGCLSLPGIYVSIKRAKKIKVSGMNSSGPIVLDAEGLLSICLQHEIDHLHGKMMTDHLSRFKQERALKKFRKLILFDSSKKQLCPKN